jgi:5-methylthioadenosine/S-adenosylhomocysteine deaminase
MNLLIKNISYLVRSPEDVDKNCDLLIERNLIGEIGKNLSVSEGCEILDGSGCIVIPGLINAHSHLYQNFLKGVAGDLSLIPWISDLLFPTVGAVREVFASGNERPAYLWTAVAAIEMIRGGITSCLNMDVMSEAIFEAWQDLGLRGVAAYTLTNRWVPEDLRSKDLETRQKVRAYINKWHHPNGMTQVFPAPSTPFLCDDELLIWARDLAVDFDLGIQIHVSETAGEDVDSNKDFGMTQIERLHKLGILSPRFSAVHCVHIRTNDIAMLADSGSLVVHCPKSNMKLADGMMPAVELKDAGVPISIATDGCGSNDLLDMWEDMRSGALLARVSNNDAAALSAVEVFRMATSEPAKVCRVDAGQLNPGSLADIAVIEINAAHLQPFHADHLMNMLVFCTKASDVRDTIINGELVMKDRKITTIDEAQLLKEAAEVEAGLYARRDHFRY